MKFLYKPFGIIAGLIGAKLGTNIFKTPLVEDRRRRAAEADDGRGEPSEGRRRGRARGRDDGRRRGCRRSRERADVSLSDRDLARQEAREQARAQDDVTGSAPTGAIDGEPPRTQSGSGVFASVAQSTITWRISPSTSISPSRQIVVAG